jgi:hypothetical protein
MVQGTLSVKHVQKGQPVFLLTTKSILHNDPRHVGMLGRNAASI